MVVVDKKFGKYVHPDMDSTLRGYLYSNTSDHERYMVFVISVTLDFHNAEIFYLHAQRLLLTTGLVTQQESDRLYMQMLIELQMQGFWGRWPVLRICGTK